MKKELIFTGALGLLGLGLFATACKAQNHAWLAPSYEGQITIDDYQYTVEPDGSIVVGKRYMLPAEIYSEPTSIWRDDHSYKDLNDLKKAIASMTIVRDDIEKAQKSLNCCPTTTLEKPCEENE